jgi:putative Mg2+ transporter-C (MgtC) family protein
VIRNLIISTSYLKTSSNIYLSMELKIWIIRIGIAFALSFLFGLESQKSHKPVGFVPFTFVSIGACMLSLMAITFGFDDPVPLIAAIVTGIGFLGAGALIKNNDKVFGFTTATSIWLFSVLGLMIGMGYYSISLIVYVLMWVSLLAEMFFEKRKSLSYQKKINFIINKLDGDKELIVLFNEFKIKKYKLLSKKVNKDSKTILLTYLVDGSGKNIRNFIEKVESNPSFIEISME